MLQSSCPWRLLSPGQTPSGSCHQILTQILSNLWFISLCCKCSVNLHNKALITKVFISQLYKKSLKIPKGNQNPYIEDERTTQWLNEKLQKDKQRSTKHTHKTDDRVQQTPLKTRGERRWSGRVSSSCPTSGTRRINLVTNPVINEERARKCLRQE